MRSRQTQLWHKASLDLGIDYVAPFVLELSFGHSLKAELLVKQFGAPNGMLIFNKSNEVMKHSDEVVSAGYGYSVLSEPSEGAEYSMYNYVELLNDWGWSGKTELVPSWIRV